MDRNLIADNAAGTWLEALFNRRPKTTTASVVVAILLVMVIGALIDGAPQ